MYSWTYRRFGCTEVHRERNTVEDPFWHIGPVSYRRMKSSSSEQSINQSALLSLVRLCDNVPFQGSELKQPKAVNFSRWEKSFSFACPFFLSKSAPVSSGLSTRRHVGNFCSHQLQTSPTPKDTPVTEGFRVRPHSSRTLPGPTAERRIHPHAGQVERWKVETGFCQRWVAARCSTAQPLLSTTLAWEKLTGGYNIHNGSERSNSVALYIPDNWMLIMMPISVYFPFFLGASSTQTADTFTGHSLCSMINMYLNESMQLWPFCWSGFVFFLSILSWTD